MANDIGQKVESQDVQEEVGLHNRDPLVSAAGGPKSDQISRWRSYVRGTLSTKRSQGGDRVNSGLMLGSKPAVLSLKTVSIYLIPTKEECRVKT